MPLPANSALTIENIESELESELGGHALEIEVARPDVLKCIKDALRLYSRWLPRTNRAAIAITEATMATIGRVWDFIGVSVDLMRRRDMRANEILS